VYECPTHRVALVLDVVVLSPPGRVLCGLTEVSFYRCPVDGCKHMKPNKWQKHPYKGNLPKRGGAGRDHRERNPDRGQFLP
jgi:hypothetical protein